MSEFASLPPVRRQDGAKIHALLAPRHCQRARNVLVPDDCAEEMPPCRCGDLTNPKKSRCTVASTKPKNVESHSPRQNRNKLIQHVRHDQTVRISGALRAWRLGGKVNALASSSKVGVTWGLLSSLGGVCYQDTYPMYRACIVHVSRMYLDVSRSYTSRYIKIHRDTFVSSLWPS